MTEYQLQILRTETVLPSKEAAITLLDTYEHHRIGQPVAVLYKSNQTTHVLYAIGKKTASSTESSNHGPEFYEIIGDGGSQDEDLVLAEDIISEYPTGVGFINNGTKLAKGSSLTELFKQMFTGEIYPDELNIQTWLPVWEEEGDGEPISKFVTPTIKLDITAKTDATVTLQITDSNGNAIEPGSTVEAGTPLTVTPAIIYIYGTTTGDEAGTLTVEHTGTDNVLWGYRVDDTGSILKDLYTKKLIATQAAAANLNLTTKTGGCKNITINNTSIPKQTFNVSGAEENKIVIDCNPASGKVSTEQKNTLYYLSNRGNTSDLHIFTVPITSGIYGGESRQYNWSCVGEYPVFTYSGTSNPKNVERKFWTNHGWVTDNDTLITDGVTVNQNAYFAIALPAGWSLKDVDGSMAGISVRNKFIGPVDSLVTSLDGVKYSIYYIQATASGVTVYRNVKINKS